MPYSGCAEYIVLALWCMKYILYIPCGCVLTITYCWCIIWPYMLQCTYVFFTSPHTIHMYTECNCHVNGSTSDICQTVGGSCTCRSNVEGRDCSSCITNYWGLNSEFGCVQCSCNDTGSWHVANLCSELALSNMDLNLYKLSGFVGLFMRLYHFEMILWRE